MKFSDTVMNSAQVNLPVIPLSSGLSFLLPQGCSLITDGLTPWLTGLMHGKEDVSDAVCVLNSAP